MSTKSDDIDLISDVGNTSTPSNRGSVFGTETLMCSRSSQVKVRSQEPVVDQGSDNEGAGDSEKKMKCVAGDIDVGAEIRSTDEVADVKQGEFDVNVKCSVEKELLAVQVVEKPCDTIEEVSIEKKAKEASCDMMNPRLVAGDASEPQNPGSSGIFPCYPEHNNDTHPCKESFESGLVNDEEHNEWSRNQAMEIDPEVENPKNLVHKEIVLGLETYVAKDRKLSDTAKKKSQSASKPECSDSDLVWGKVRSHPWWPGQILDAAVASKKAKKYFKKGSYLIAYFGDQTFAWNEGSHIKPFRDHFSQMEKQSSLEDFHDAIDCALDEASRRVEFGLACSCISEVVYNKIKTQTIVNTGIQEESCRREGGDKFSTAASFEPMKLVEYIKSLAGFSSYGVTDRLEFVTVQAQLLAFHRWKGYPELPVFATLCGSLETAPPELSVSGQAENNSDSVAEPKVTKHLSSEKSVSVDIDVTGQKRKNSSEDDHSLGKKEKTLSELIAERRLSRKSRNGLDDKSGGKLVTDKKRKIEDLVSSDALTRDRKNKLKKEDSADDDSEVKDKREDLSSGNASKSPPAKPVYRVGASILKVASQLNGSNPIILEPSDSASKRTIVKNKKAEKSFPEREDLAQSEISSLDEMLSHLISVAKSPKGKISCLKSLVGFLSDFKSSISMDNPVSGEFQQFLEEAFAGDIQECSRKSGITGASESNDVKGTSEAVEFVSEVPDEKVTEKITQENNCPDSQEKLESGNLPVGHSGESCKQDFVEGDACSPTALILNFTDLRAVPSEKNLNKIFSRYGPLRESETEVLKKRKRAKVVFLRSEDAETAFSSAGKYSIFGPSLLSYRLKYVNSTPEKPSKEEDSAKRNAF